MGRSRLLRAKFVLVRCQLLWSCVVVLNAFVTRIGPNGKRAASRRSRFFSRDAPSLHMASLEMEPHRQRRKLRLKSGKEAPLLSRTVEIDSEWNITVWEWEKTAEEVDFYWQAQTLSRSAGLASQPKLLDPFGLILWPGSVVAAQELKIVSRTTVKDKIVLILGGGVGVEAQAAAELGAKEVLATDIHPTTLEQLRLGVQENSMISDSTRVETAIFDLFSKDPLPCTSADLIVVADLLYNEQLASQVVQRLAEAWHRNPKVQILVTDSQRFVDFHEQLITALEKVASETSQSAPIVHFVEYTLSEFTGSGVCIDEDQTYEVKVRSIWIGLRGTL